MLRFDGDPSGGTRSQRGYLIALFLLFLIVLLRTAWLCDDAYISLRTVDNFVAGHGLRWNVAERVQSYTHPLWVLLLSCLYCGTRELYLTTLLSSLLLSAAAVALTVGGLARSLVAALAGLSILTLSPAFVDYCTSGLENPLSYLLMALFLLVYWRVGDGPRRSFLLALLAGLALTTRLDHLWLYAPPLLLELRRRHDRRALCLMLGGMAPIFLWTLFSLVYYGFPVANSAVAKLNLGIPRTEIMARGLFYMVDALRYETLCVLTILWALVTSLRGRDGGQRAFGVGISLHLIYLVFIGGDFMRGRFLSLPLLLAVGLLLRGEFFLARRARLLLFPVCLILGFAAPSPTLLSGAGHGGDAAQASMEASHGIADERGYYYGKYGLLNGKPIASKLGANMADLHARQAALSIRLMEVFTAGENAFSIGPGAHVIDALGLGDPLLARLDMREDAAWRIGHYPRVTPAGYLLTALTGENHMVDPEIREYYDHLVLLTRGPLFTMERWRAIAAMNLGRYERLVDGNRDYEAVGIRDYIALADGVPDLGSSRVLWDVGRHFMARGEFEASAPYLRRLIALRAGYAASLLDIARGYERGGDDAGSEACLRTLAEIDPCSAEALYRLAALCSKQGREEEALDLLKQSARAGHGPAVQYLKKMGKEWR